MRTISLALVVLAYRKIRHDFYMKIGLYVYFLLAPSLLCEFCFHDSIT